MITPDMNSANAQKSLLAFFWCVCVLLTKCDRLYCFFFACAVEHTEAHMMKHHIFKSQMPKIHWKCTVDLMWHFEKLDLHAYWATNEHDRESHVMESVERWNERSVECWRQTGNHQINSLIHLTLRRSIEPESEVHPFVLSVVFIFSFFHICIPCVSRCVCVRARMCAEVSSCITHSIQTQNTLEFEYTYELCAKTTM